MKGRRWEGARGAKWSRTMRRRAWERFRRAIEVSWTSLPTEEPRVMFRPSWWKMCWRRRRRRVAVSRAQRAVGTAWVSSARSWGSVRLARARAAVICRKAALGGGLAGCQWERNAEEKVTHPDSVGRTPDGASRASSPGTRMSGSKTDIALLTAKRMGCSWVG